MYKSKHNTLLHCATWSGSTCGNKGSISNTNKSNVYDNITILLTKRCSCDYHDVFYGNVEDGFETSQIVRVLFDSASFITERCQRFGLQRTGLNLDVVGLGRSLLNAIL